MVLLTEALERAVLTAAQGDSDDVVGVAGRLATEGRGFAKSPKGQRLYLLSHVVGIVFDRLELEVRRWVSRRVRAVTRARGGR